MKHGKNNMNKRDRIRLLNEASEKINLAIEDIREAISGTEYERYAESYILAHLKNWANGGASLDITIPELIVSIKKHYRK
jgi:hypothetical protein